MRAISWPSICIIPIFAVAVYGADVAPVRHDVPMVDGIKLATDVYLPAGNTDKLPTLLVLTPYGRGGAKGLAQGFVKSGYAVVSQDIRGRGESEGSNVVIFQAGAWDPPADGHTTLRWITSQPWSNGKIATWGGSAVGITQNLLNPYAPDSLKAQFVEVASSNLYSQCMYQGGALRKEMMEGWLAATGMTKGNLDAFHSHPAYDAFWETLNPEKVAEHAVAPGIFVGGWYDIFCQGTINSFLTIQEKVGSAARGRCRLIMGPWAHGPVTELKYPDIAQKRPQAADAKRYFDHLLKGEDNGADQDLPVHYFVMGDPEAEGAPGNVWRTEKSWPPESQPTPFYFHPDGSLSSASGTSASSMSYNSDPKNPVLTIGGQNLLLPKGPMDQRKMENRKDVLLFSTQPLSEPMEITGRLIATLYVNSDAPDTDFVVKLSDVYPDGRSMLVTDGILRARYRNSFEKPEFMSADQTYKIDVDLSSVSIIINKGHQIRLAVCSSNSPRFDVNPNTGKNSWEETEPRIAKNTIHLGGDSPSHILFPVRPASSEGK